MRIDRFDLALLQALQQDSHLTNAELGNRISLSPSQVSRRIQRLEAEGVIGGYAAWLRPQALGLGLQAFVRVQLEKHGQHTMEPFAQAVQDWDEVVACHALTGDMDYLLHVVVPDLDRFSAFLLDKLLNSAGVADVNSSFVLRTVKQTGAMPLAHLA